MRIHSDRAALFARCISPGNFALAGMNFTLNRRVFAQWKRNVVAKWLLWAFVALGSFGIPIHASDGNVALVILLAAALILCGALGYHEFRHLESNLAAWDKAVVSLENERVALKSSDATHEISYDEIRSYWVLRQKGIRYVVLCLSAEEQLAVPPINELDKLLEELERRMPGKLRDAD